VYSDAGLPLLGLMGRATNDDDEDDGAAAVEAMPANEARGGVRGSDETEEEE
jgi:hypothetical protein